MNRSLKKTGEKVFPNPKNQIKIITQAIKFLRLHL